MEKDNNCVPRSRNECGHPEHSERVKCCDFFENAPYRRQFDRAATKQSTGVYNLQHKWYSIISLGNKRKYCCAVSTERS